MSQKLKTVRANIKDVASVAGVSTQTVSRVINDRPDVSSETRRRVKEVIERVGYRPSALARSLISQRSYTLGVAIAGLNYYGPLNALSGIASAAEEAGYSLLLRDLPDFEEGNIESIMQAFLSRHVDGVIWAVSQVGSNRSWINLARFDKDIPIVYLMREPQENITVVSINNYSGGQLAMAHLWERGYRHIGHITGPLDWWEARERMKAWQDFLINVGVDVQDIHWVEGNWSPVSGALAMEKLLASYPTLDAVFTGNDQMGLGALQTLQRNGFKVPDDIGIVGFDDIQESAYFSPPMSTVQQDLYFVARTAVTEMIKIIEAGYSSSSPIEPKSILLEPTLVARESSLRQSAIKNKGGD